MYKDKNGYSVHSFKCLSILAERRCQMSTVVVDFKQFFGA